MTSIIKRYVNNLNAAIAKYPDLAYGCVDCILGDIANVPEGHPSSSYQQRWRSQEPHHVLDIMTNQIRLNWKAL